MLRNEIQNKTGLTRKALEYYEEKGLIRPHKAKNGYREYSEENLQTLTQISLLRIVGRRTGVHGRIKHSFGLGYSKESK